MIIRELITYLEQLEHDSDMKEDTPVTVRLSCIEWSTGARAIAEIDSIYISYGEMDRVEIQAVVSEDALKYLNREFDEFHLDKD